MYTLSKDSSNKQISFRQIQFEIYSILHINSINPYIHYLHSNYYHLLNYFNKSLTFILDNNKYLKIYAKEGNLFKLSYLMIECQNQTVRNKETYNKHAFAYLQNLLILLIKLQLKNNRQLICLIFNKSILSFQKKYNCGLIMILKNGLKQLLSNAIIKDFVHIHLIIGNSNINGLQFLALKPQDLLQKYQIRSQFVLKRIMDWITIEKDDFNLFVDEQNQNLNAAILTDQLNAQDKQLKVLNYPPETQKHPLRQLSILQQQPQYVKFINSQMIIPKLKRLTFLFNKKIHHIKNIAKIGRLTSNDIVINEQSVSRNHAEIMKQQDSFYLMDIGSKYGTYVQDQKIIAENNKIFLIGLNQIQIKQLKIYKNNGQDVFDIKLIFVNSEDRIVSFTNKSYINIGNKNKDLSISDDQICSNHGKIYIQQGIVYIEEISGQIYVKLQKNNKLKIHSGRYRFGVQNVKIKIQQYCQICEENTKKCRCKNN